MPQFFADLLRQLHPSGERLQLMNRFQRRALVPTWPVTATLAILGGALLFAGQGQAIVRYTSTEFGSEPFTEPVEWMKSAVTWVFLTVHSIIMMYVAFLLSAVTRRNYLDESAAKTATGMSDPVDPSIKLRLVYSYLCGVFLPLLCMAMALWFRYGWTDPGFWIGVALGMFGAVLYLQFAHRTYPVVSRALGRLYADRESARPMRDAIARPVLRVLRFSTQPTHRIAQCAIVILSVLMGWLWFLQAFGDDIPGKLFEDYSGENLTTASLLNGATAFFGSFLFIHTFFRLLTERFVKLHHGHTARYIIIDRKLSNWFSRLRLVGIVAIPVSFWFSGIVSWLGPLNVGLFGTLWVTLVLSYLVESGARRPRLPTSNAAEDGQTVVPKQLRRLSKRSWFFVFLIALLITEQLLGLSEFLHYRHSWPMIAVLIASTIKT
ncbi:MAG: hypothetical protein RLN72_06055, partial [Henriciella sp.]